MDTLNYKRKTRGQLALLRLIFLLAAILVIYLLGKSIFDYAIFISLLLLPTVVITLVKLTISNSSVKIIKYSLFGLLKKEYELTAENILSMTVHEELIELDDKAIGNGDNTLDFILLLSPVKTLGTNTTKFIYTDKNNIEKNLTVKLKTNEYKLAWFVLNGQKQ